LLTPKYLTTQLTLTLFFKKNTFLTAPRKQSIGLFVLVFFALFNKQIYALEIKYPLFKKGDIVCFVGNSITQAGGFHHNILRYYLTGFHLKELSFIITAFQEMLLGGY
jgi:hypothetical protein